MYRWIVFPTSVTLHLSKVNLTCPFITSQSVSQNAPCVLHSDSLLNILNKFSIISKPCHLPPHFLFQISCEPSAPAQTPTEIYQSLSTTVKTA